MALSRQEFSEMLSQILPDDLPSDPEISYRPTDTSIRRRNKLSGTGGLSGRRMTRWAIVRPDGDSSSHPPSGNTVEALPRIIRDSDTQEVEFQEAEYILLRMMGRGGFGEVWEAVQGSVGRIVAVKRLRDDLIEKQTYDAGEEDRMVEDFQREALTTAILEHPNIVPVHDVGTDELGRPLLAMKMVRGTRWDHMLADDRESLPLPDYLARHLPILVDVAQAVGFAHSRGIVHRDLKPAQVMVGEFGETILMDWGMALQYDPELLKAVLGDDQVPNGIAPTKDVAFNPSGTPSYMAPEQTLPSASDIGPWTDIYLLGGLLYYVLTGKGPHAVGDAKEAFVLASQGEIVPFDEACPGREIPSELAAVAMTALSADPAARYPTASHFLSAIEDYRTGAGRRRESLSLTEEVMGEEIEELADYQQLTACSTKLLRALALWPENPDARALQNRVYQQFARFALQNKDLVLARLMAESISERHDKSELLARIQQADRQAAWSNRQKLVLKIVTSILVAVIVFDIYLLVTWSTTGSDNALRARATAAETRAQAAEEQLRAVRAELEALTPEAFE